MRWLAMGEQKTRAVASLQTRMRVVASIEVLNSWELMGLNVQAALRSVRSDVSAEQLNGPSIRDIHAVLPSFAQLAMACSNPTLVSCDAGSPCLSDIFS